MESPATQDIADALRVFFAEHAEERGVAAVYLFGSVARGTAGPRSDVDIGVLYSGQPPAGLRRFALEGELEEVLRRPVQVVTLDAASPDLVHRVLRDGILVAELDRSRRIAFEVRSRAEYLDLEPVRRLYRRLPGTAE